MQSIEECTKTKSILCVLGPIAQKILQLKHTHKGVVCEAHIILHLIKQCESLKLACQHLKEHLISEAERLADQILFKEIHQLHHPLLHSIENLTESTKDLHRSDAHVKDINEVWEQLISFAEDILGCLIKILLSWDHAHQRRINSSIDAFLVSVNSLQDASLEQLPLHFEKVIDKVEEIFHLVTERSANICRVTQRETLFILSLRLQKTLPFLACVIMKDFCHSAHGGVKACRGFVVEEVRHLVQSLRKEMSLGSHEYDLQEPANYVHTLNDLFDLLTLCPGENGVEKLPLLDTIKSSVETVLQHSICVALYGTSQDYSLIMTACENVLHQMKVLSKAENSEYPNPSDVDVVLDVIVDVLEVLEIRVNASLVRLIVQCFTEPFSTLESLLEASKTSQKEAPQSGLRLEDRLSPLVSAFEEQVDRFYQIGGLIIACVAEPSKVRQIECSLAVLGWLEAGVVAAVRSKTNKIQSSHTEVLILSRQWVNEVVDFRRLIFSLLELDTLLQVIKQEIHKAWAEVRDEAESRDPAWLRERVKTAVSHTQSLLTLNEECLYLTDAQRMNLIKSVMEVRKYEAMTSSVDFNEKVRKGLVKRLQYMLTTVNRISASFSRPTLIESRAEEDLFGYQVYEAGYSAAMKGFCESDVRNEGLMLSNISNLSSDFSHVSQSQSEPAVATSLPIFLDPKRELADVARKNVSFQSVFKDKSLKMVRRTSRATKRQQTQITSGQGNKMEDDLKGTSFSNISVDITKFLVSRSTNTFRSSTRASRRNISIKVKQINLDIGEVVKITTKAQAPKYVVPYRKLLEEELFAGFTEAIEKMEKLTTTVSSSVSQRYEPKGKWFTVGGHDGTKQFKKKNLFYKTFNPLLSVHETPTDFVEPRQEPDDCPEWKSLVESLQRKNVYWSNGYHKECEENDTTDDSLNRLKTLNCLDTEESTSELNPRDVCVYSNSDLIASIATPSSVEMNTQERLEDISVVRRRLASLKSAFDIV